MANRTIIRLESVAFNGYTYLLTLWDKQRGILFLYLPSLDWRNFEDEDYKNIMIAIDSDGCTGVPDFYLNGCIVHDFHYATHKDFNGEPISRSAADARFRKYIQNKSKLGFLSPMSWWRWAAVRLFGEKAWEKDEQW